MADFVAVLRKTIDGLGTNTPEMRQKVYEKARTTVAAKLAAIDPPPAANVIERQKRALEDAIASVEASYAPPAPEPGGDEELEELLASLETREPQPVPPPPAGLSPVSAAAAPFEPTAEARADVGGEQEEGEAPDPHHEDAAPVSDAPDAYETAATEQQQPDELVPVIPAKRPEPPLPGSGPQDDPEPALAATPGAARPRRRRRGGLIAALLVLLVLAGAAYGIWLNRAEFADLVGLGATPVAVQPDAGETSAAAETEAVPDEEETGAEAADGAAAPPPDETETAEETPTPAAEDDFAKFTQRLMPDGEEIDEGPADARPTIGEGSSVAAATRGTGEGEEGTGVEPGAPAVPPAGGPEALPVGQRAIFYEERTSLADGSADVGATVWSVVRESPGGDLPPEPAIRAEVSIPAKDLQLRLTIRRNGDQTLPASHIVEMIFLTPENFPGGAIANVLQIALKNSEEAPGRPLIGIPAKIADGFFLLALTDAPAEQQSNMQLLRQTWIDIPIIYSTGRRALVTLEKGIPGERIFEEALQAWQNATSG